MVFTLRCINCAIRLDNPRIVRRSIDELSVSLRALLQSWILPVEITPEDVVCEKCYNIVRIQSVSEQPRRGFGYTSVCLGCGVSVLRGKSIYLDLNRPEANVIISWVPQLQVSHFSRMCRACWRRATRQVERERGGASGVQNPVVGPTDTSNVMGMQSKLQSNYIYMNMSKNDFAEEVEVNDEEVGVKEEAVGVRDEEVGVKDEEVGVSDEVVGVKDEIEIGPTLIQPRLCETPTAIKVDWSEGFDITKPISTTIIFDDENGDSGKLITGECLPENFSSEQWLRDEAGNQEVKDVKSYIKEESLEYEVGGELVSSDEQAQPRTTPESHESDSLIGRDFSSKICNDKSTKAPERHIRTRTYDRPFECEICNAKFTRTNHLESHMRTHTGESLYRCEICDAKYMTSGSLKYHTRIHTGERPFDCKICNGKFKTASHLNNHYRTHTGERYQCEICSAKFTRTGNLKNHTRTHANERLFECEICNNKFRSVTSLKSHTRIHEVSDHLSEMNNTNIATTNSLKTYSLIHTTERPFECEICSDIWRE